MKVGRIKDEKIFQDCLEAIQKGEDAEEVLNSYPEQAQELRRRLVMAERVTQSGDALASRAGFITASRQHLIDRLRGESLSQATRPRDTRRLRAYQHRRVWLALNLFSVVILMFVLGAVGVKAFASAEKALPGDALYTVKILSEQVRLEAAVDPARKAQLHVRYAGIRSSEIVELIFEGRFEYLTPTSANLKDHVRQADYLLRGLKTSDPSLSVSLSKKLENTFTDQNLLLDVLIQSVPEEARLGIEEAMTLAVR
jgi:hypothetical protein